ncbi:MULTISPECIES: bifunctional DNA-formamidopyrimidine glycosylase/DNA-(apurinic or apyrimidinic site) lyase [Terrabacteria group]|uniref:bifunctional DNA-formamidopyrimidine glycosylase/DNA-(apurinic or apyrimidinic site) lyase n=1 Tax=Bacillati TaxID=1783272 RepID=UPI001C6EEB8D|nr:MULTISPECIES: bifunctional DNA-formamidopyrimidine glycosylase/DNA-(apurinic or apyrimidinic site) lyase [Terrabacteria group]MBW9212032.1 bifunctional DNA-formamidopyrimidine glycosylase/DNA-(apurinic or apyrimidinic site) lyase [Trueperella sp. zg.1013]
MPELPEVETVIRTLDQQIARRRIEAIQVYYDKVVGHPKSFIDTFTGQHFCSFSRRGKYLLLGMDKNTLVVHLRMEGKFYIQDPSVPLNRHIHVVFSLDNGMELRYMDTRKFGRMEILPKDFDLRSFHGLGPEPFADEFNGDYVYSFLKKKKAAIKSVLLDQSFVAGIGNIYADEVLAKIGVRPKMRACRLSKKKCAELVMAIQEILSGAIELGGTTIRSYTSSLGVTGLFQTECAVHMQKICPKCQAEIKAVRVGGRSSYYCPHCQKS